MPASWDEIRQSIEEIEISKISAELTLLTLQEQGLRERPLTEEAKGYLKLLGGITVGITAGILAIVMSYLVFVQFLHISFDLI
jgi:hypothetical protein